MCLCQSYKISNYHRCKRYILRWRLLFVNNLGVSLIFNPLEREYNTKTVPIQYTKVSFYSKKGEKN